MGCGGSKSVDISSSSRDNTPSPAEGIRKPHGADNDDGITTVGIEEEKSPTPVSGEASNQEEKFSPQEEPDLLVKEEVVQIETIDEDEEEDKAGIEGNFDHLTTESS